MRLAARIAFIVIFALILMAALHPVGFPLVAVKYPAIFFAAVFAYRLLPDKEERS